MTRSASSPHHVDKHVGALIRSRRRALGISQTVLATALGVTFQQVQKYERGSNRVSASKLYEVAQKLDVPLASFFEGLEVAEAASMRPAVLDFLNERGSRELIEAYLLLSPTLRSRLVALASTMAGRADEAA